MFQILFYVFILIVNQVRCIALPPYIKSCSRNDPNLNACALEAARESIHTFSLGDTERDFIPLDPLHVPELRFFVPNENGLKVLFLDNLFKGLSNLHMEDLRFDLNKKIIYADCLVTLDVAGKYDLSGKLLVMPVKSNGNQTIKLKNTMIHLRFFYDHVDGDDGKVHWKIYKHDIKYEVERAYFKLDNLLNDKSISDQINKLLNEMWKEIVNAVGPAIATALVDAVVRNLGVLLEQVSFDELMPA